MQLFCTFTFDFGFWFWNFIYLRSFSQLLNDLSSRFRINAPSWRRWRRNDRRWHCRWWRTTSTSTTPSIHDLISPLSQCFSPRTFIMYSQWVILALRSSWPTDSTCAIVVVVLRKCMCVRLCVCIRELFPVRRPLLAQLLYILDSIRCAFLL